MNKHIMLAALLAVLSDGALAANWKLVSTSDTSIIYVDTTSIAKSPIGRKAWVWFEYNAPKKIPLSYPEKYFTSVVELDHYDCQNRTSAAAQQLSYASAGKSGDVVDSRSIRNVKDTLEDVVPDTVGETLLNFVCSAPFLAK